MIMSGEEYGGAGGEKSPRNTHTHTQRSPGHILCCGLLVILGLQIEEFGLSRFKCCKTVKRAPSLTNSLLPGQHSNEKLEPHFDKKGTKTKFP